MKFKPEVPTREAVECVCYLVKPFPLIANGETYWLRPGVTGLDETNERAYDDESDLDEFDP